MLIFCRLHDNFPEAARQPEIETSIQNFCCKFFEYKKAGIVLGLKLLVR